MRRSRSEIGDAVKKLTRTGALRLSRHIMENAECERAQIVAEEAARGLQWPHDFTCFPPTLEVRQECSPVVFRAVNVTVELVQVGDGRLRLQFHDGQVEVGAWEQISDALCSPAQE